MSVLIIDKPCGMSSLAAVKRVRALLGKGREKIGHGGTLDPFASGVLPICMGEGTKILRFLLDADKAYETLVRFGVETDTLDLTGRVVAEHSLEGLTWAKVASCLGQLRGTIEQVPPMYSALKRDGRPLYRYARAGLTVERAPRKVTIHVLDLIGFEPPDRARLSIRCSKGTYIRSLAADLGKLLGVGAHLVELRRTASGPFNIEQAITLDELSARVAEARPLPVLSPLQALSHLPAVEVDEASAQRIARGQPVDWAAFAAGRTLDGPVCAVRASETGPVLIAVVTRKPDGSLGILRGFR